MSDQYVKVHYPSHSEDFCVIYIRVGTPSTYLDFLCTFLDELKDERMSLKLFTSLRPEYLCYWIDEDGDKVAIKTDSSFRAFLHNAMKPKTVYIAETDAAKIE